MSAKQPMHTPSVLSPAVRAELLQLVEGYAGLRLSPQQAGLLEQIIAEQISVSSYQVPEQLSAALAGGQEPALLDELVARLTIGETHFFRIRPQIELLRTLVLPDLIRRHQGDRRLRLWSAGCSSGEEPYTLAMLLTEAVQKVAAWDVRIWGTDLNQAALGRARAAVYGDWSFRDTPAYVRERYFIRNERRWQLVEAIKRMVQFASWNLAASNFHPPEAGAFDLILCRNVTIYFSPEATQQLYRRFATVLEPGGWLVLGPSDPTPDRGSGLEVVRHPGAILWRRPEQEAPTPDVLAPRAPLIPLRPAPPSRQPPGPLLARPQPASPVVGELARARPLDPADHLQLGMLLLEQGKTSLAIESLRRATFLDPQHALAHFGLGRAYYQDGDTTRARVALRQARSLVAAIPAGEKLPGSDELSVERLRHAIDMLFVALDRA